MKSIFKTTALFAIIGLLSLNAVNATDPDVDIKRFWQKDTVVGSTGANSEHYRYLLPSCITSSTAWASGGGIGSANRHGWSCWHLNDLPGSSLPTNISDWLTYPGCVKCGISSRLISVGIVGVEEIIFQNVDFFRKHKAPSILSLWLPVLFSQVHTS
jgi:hypothetical protein